MQNIPCKFRLEFLDHFDWPLLQQVQFQIDLKSLKQPGPTYTVQVTNEANRTFFTGLGWTEMVDAYEMDAREKLVFYLYQNHMTYFDYRGPEASTDSDVSDDEIPVAAITYGTDVVDNHV